MMYGDRGVAEWVALVGRPSLDPSDIDVTTDICTGHIQGLKSHLFFWGYVTRCTTVMGCYYQGKMGNTLLFL